MEFDIAFKVLHKYRSGPKAGTRHVLNVSRNKFFSSAEALGRAGASAASHTKVLDISTGGTERVFALEIPTANGVENVEE
jgi:hypothetical protein